MFLLALCAVTALQAQTPSADKIVDNYIKAIGGEKQWKALKTLKMAVTMRMSGFDIPGEVSARADGKQRMEFSVNGMKIIQSWDGTNAWTVNPLEGASTPRLMKGEEAEDISDGQFLDEFIDYKKEGSTISFLGEEQFEGLPYYLLSMKKKDGTEATYLFDQETGLMVIKRVSSEAGKIETYFQDYQTTEGLTMPMKVVNKVNGQVVQSFTINEAWLDAAMPDDLFAFPGN